jgi:hypothetical protein
MSIFSKVKINKPKSNTFDLSHDRKFSLKFGELVPCFVMDCIPGDKINLSTSQMMRFAPLIAPIMHSVNVYVHFFYVPNRILWDNWENFITGGEDGTADPVFPYFTSQSSIQDIGTLGDYLGLPEEIVDGMQVSALPFAAYQRIYDDYYRDQNLISANPSELSDGNNTADIDDFNVLRKRAWQHDYFTSALPWTQKGPEATLPLGDSAPINYTWSGNINDNTTIVRDKSDGNPLVTPLESFGTQTAGQAITGVPGTIGTDFWRVDIDNSSALTADLSNATAATINDLRQAFRLQEWLEKNARGGSRYIESMLVHFGVKSSDSRLQRAEYLGGGSAPVTISEVLQTSDAAAEDTPQGNMAGHGIAVGATNKFSYFAEEHGYILGIMSVMPKSAYQQGVPKHWSKFDKFDYYWPSFAHLGEQPVLNQELYCYDDDENQSVFGYTPRYAEYKFINPSVHGEFKNTLNIWHMGRIFSSRPLLNQDFIEMDDAEVSRVFAVEEDEKLYCHMFHRVTARRPMPYFGTPSGV